jgi:hypothetical protein
VFCDFWLLTYLQARRNMEGHCIKQVASIAPGQMQTAWHGIQCRSEYFNHEPINTCFSYGKFTQEKNIDVVYECLGLASIKML